MNQFKLNDWVNITKQNHTRLLQLTKVENIRGSNMLYFGKNEYSIFEERVNTTSTHLELWRPKEGEWCWFWDNDDLPFLLQATGEMVKTSNGYLYFSKQKQRHGNDASSNCEPFIGELPSFLKET